ncbi:deoxynucleotidyltransferase terminal-interacting protein 2 [Ciona intestinalis]
MPRRSSRLLSKQSTDNDVCVDEKIQENNEISLEHDDQKSNTESIDSNGLNDPARLENVENGDDFKDDIESDVDIDKLADDISDQILGKTKKNLQTNEYFFTYDENEEKEIRPSSEIEVGDIMEDCYVTVTPNVNNGIKVQIEDTMAKSVLTPGFESLTRIPCAASRRSQVKQRRLERKKTSGKKWFNMKCPEITEEIRNDLKVLEMRSVLDPKRFYKHNDRRGTPKFFQMGKIMDNSSDFYSSRVTKKERKSTLVGELLADAKFKKYQKRKYNEIQAKRRALGFKQHTRKFSKFSKHKNN